LKEIWLECEVGERLSVHINTEMCGFGISFDEYDMPSDCNMPSEDALKRLIKEVKKVMSELNIEQPSYFILKLENRVQHFSNNVGSNGVFLLRLPSQISKDKIEVHYKHLRNDIHDRQELYHELIHVKDVVCDRFPTIGRGKNMVLINFLWGFSIEGRLERMRKPHLEREEAIQLHKDPELSGSVSRKQAEELCEELWGKEVTYEEIKSIAKKLMHVCR